MCGRPSEPAADLILTGGDVLTLGSPGVVEALAVRGDRVAAAGTSQEVGRLADLVATAEHYLYCADPCLESMQVDMTVVGGRVV